MPAFCVTAGKDPACPSVQVELLRKTAAQVLLECKIIVIAAFKIFATFMPGTHVYTFR